MKGIYIYMKDTTEKQKFQKIVQDSPVVVYVIMRLYNILTDVIAVYCS